MASISMEAEPRTGFGKGPNRRLRAAGKIPAVLYGGGKDPVPLSVDPREVAKIIRSHGGVNTIFELSVEGAKSKDNVMIREYQIEPVDHALLHADLVRVAMDKTMTLTVSIELTGTAVGVKQGGGMLDFVTRTVEISCLPSDIPETLVIDVSELDVGDYIRASSLSLPKGVTLESEANVVIAHVMAPKAEVEEVPEGEVAVEGAEAPEGAEGAEASAEGGEQKE
jgi:large subunit ribosomal protein L25